MCPGSVGWFGKLPARGDFIASGLPQALTQRLDAWMQAGIRRTRAACGDAWPEQFAAMPSWRFVMPPGSVDPDGWLGALAPSMDRAGRQFPMLVCACGGSARDWPDYVGSLVPEWWETLETGLREVVAGAEPETLEALEQALLPHVAHDDPLAGAASLDCPADTPIGWWRLAPDGELADALCCNALTSVVFVRLMADTPDDTGHPAAGQGTDARGGTEASTDTSNPNEDR